VSTTSPMLMESVETRLNYLAANETRPVSLMTRPGVPVQKNAEYEKRTVQVNDARNFESTLDEHGFTLVPEPDGCADYFDHELVVKDYYPRMEALVQAHTGARRVVAFDHNVRSGDAKQQQRAGVREPVRVVHNDYTTRSGPLRVRDLLPDEADSLLRGRFAVVNVWRPIVGPVQSQPLGVCDASSMAEQDFVVTDLEYGERTGEVYQITWNPAHRWFYYSDMLAHEALLLKCFDSSDDGYAKFTAHSAFTHPATQPDCAPRQSIETRTLVFF